MQRFDLLVFPCNYLHESSRNIGKQSMDTDPPNVARNTNENGVLENSKELLKVYLNRMASLQTTQISNSN